MKKVKNAIIKPVHVDEKIWKSLLKKGYNISAEVRKFLEELNKKKERK